MKLLPKLKSKFINVPDRGFGKSKIYTSHGGKGQPLLLIHGNPMCQLTWHKILPALNGKILTHGGNFKVLEGTDQIHRFVIIEFPSLEEGGRCWSSKEYQKASSFRKDGFGLVDLILIESGDATKQ